MFCPKCGNNNEDGARFCHTCGAPLSQPQQPQQSSYQQPYQPQQPQYQQPQAPRQYSARPQASGVMGFIGGLNLNLIVMILSALCCMLWFLPQWVFSAFGYSVSVSGCTATFGVSVMGETGGGSFWYIFMFLIPAAILVLPIFFRMYFKYIAAGGGIFFFILLFIFGGRFAGMNASFWNVLLFLFALIIAAAGVFQILKDSNKI